MGTNLKTRSDRALGFDRYAALAGLIWRTAAKARYRTQTRPDPCTHMVLKHRQCLGEMKKAPERPRVVLIISSLLIVVVRDEDRRVVERVMVEAVLPANAAAQFVAVANLIGVAHDDRVMVVVDPLSEVKDRVGERVVDEMAAPASGRALRRTSMRCRTPDLWATRDDAVTAPAQNNARGVARLGRHSSARWNEGQIQIRGVETSPLRNDIVRDAFDLRLALHDVQPMDAL